MHSKIEEANMRTAFVAVMCSALWVAASPALAQQKTVQVCRDEWRANRAANEAAGIAVSKSTEHDLDLPFTSLDAQRDALTRAGLLCDALSRAVADAPSDRQWQ
jgi:hypothetical protein